MFMGMDMHELGMNKGINHKLHARESYSHAHEAMTSCAQAIFKGLKHEHSLFLGMNLQKNSCSRHEFCMNMA